MWGDMCEEQEGGSRDLPAPPEPQHQTCHKHQGHYHHQEDQAPGVGLLCGFSAQRMSFPIHPGLNCISLVLFALVTLCITNCPSSSLFSHPALEMDLHPTLCILPHLQDTHPQLFHFLDY